MNTENIYDVIIAGAGSIGTPTALRMAEAGLKVLVLDPLPSTGQASNKHAIGGIRATHSDASKIYLCTESIRVFSSWHESYGDDLEWRAGGYSFVAYSPEVMRVLKDLLTLQQAVGLNIRWCEPAEMLRLMPDLTSTSLLGGTYSPEDGSASPLKASFAFHKHALRAGAQFHFNEAVSGVDLAHRRVNAVHTSKQTYACKVFINAAGSWAAGVSDLLAVPLPVVPEAHEAGITEPVQAMFMPMVVDIRSKPGSSNFYFYQHPTGKIIFCLTPSPQILGNLTLDTAGFLPLAAKRLIELMPKLANCRVRRTWRGTYPITPDGLPFLGKVEGVEGYLLAAGACGQGFMLGPGIAQLLTNLVMGNLSEAEQMVLDKLALTRVFSAVEKLK